jgi:hypothetical protein
MLESTILEQISIKALISYRVLTIIGFLDYVHYLACPVFREYQMMDKV